MDQRTIATKNTLELISRFDGMKEFIPSIKQNSLSVLVEKDDSSAFPLFYAINAFFGNPSEPIEMEAIDYIECSEINTLKIKTLASVFHYDSVWIDIFAFNAFACVANNKEFEPGQLEDLSAEEIVWSIIMIGAIEGSMNFPFSDNVMKAITGWLKIDGWIYVPLHLMFENFIAYTSGEEHLSKSIEELSSLSMSDMAFENISSDYSPETTNYLLLNMRISKYIVEKIGELSSGWSKIITHKEA